MKKSLADHAYNVIKRDIITCELDPGAQIAQSSLVDRYGVGITPIREALKRLEQDGYVQSVPRFGYIISTITISDVKDIYELRLILETASVRLAAERASDEQLAEINENAGFSYRYKDRESYLQFLEFNTFFHTMVAKASGNQRLANALEELLNAMTRIFNLGLDLRDSAEEMRNEHLRLANALCQHDPDLSAKIINEQVLSSQQRVLEMMWTRMGGNQVDLNPVSSKIYRKAE
jgi:DNA-binding GntR family transcriptional regulator